MISEVVSHITAFNAASCYDIEYWSHSFTAVAAAFSTLGYYTQADFVRYLTETPFGNWAPLIYMCAAIAGVVGLAIGAPPRQYMWFFLGPGIYWWLLYTPVESYGTEWRVDTGAPLDQTEVYRRLEVGLANLPYAQQLGVTTSAKSPPSRPATVPKMFAWYDSVVSEAVIYLASWTGAGVLVDGQGGSDTNITKLGTGAPGVSTDRTNRYSIMSNIKWNILENITGARLHSGDLRDLLVTFLSSECGDALAGAIDETAFVAAGNAKSGRLPCTIFPDSSSGTTMGPNADCSYEPGGDYKTAVAKLEDPFIPTPRGLKRLAEDKGKGAFSCFFEGSGSGSGPIAPSGGGGCSGDKLSAKAAQEEIACMDLLWVIINGFRWEAGHIYYQLIAEAPGGLSEAEIMFSLFYGWGLQDSSPGGSTKLLPASGGTPNLSTFAKDLIIVYLLRNEMAIAPQVVDARFSGVFNAVSSQSDTALSTSGARSRAGEIYAYAMLIPYVQGCLLYLFAMAYPFAVVLMLVPGWHKSIFTWMSFWAWVKLWDVGFAIVTALERSVWSMMGNGSSAKSLSPWISGMSNFGGLDVEACNPTPVASAAEMCSTSGNASDCAAIPYVYGSGDGVSVGDYQSILKIFDRSIVLGPAVDFDVYNAYYLYIMVALYTAVPAVTAQLVLGARAGAAGLISGLYDGAKQDAGRATSGAFTGNLRQHAAANQASVSQEAAAKSFRKDGLAGAAIEAGNKQVMGGIQSARASAFSSSLDKAIQMNGYNSQNAGAALDAGVGLIRGLSDFNSIKALGATGILDAAQNSVTKGDGRPSEGHVIGGSSRPAVPGSGGGIGSDVIGGGGGGSPGSAGGGIKGGGGVPISGNAPASNDQKRSQKGDDGSASAAFLFGAGVASKDPHSRGFLFDAVGTVGRYGITRGYNDTNAALVAAQAGQNVAGFKGSVAQNISGEDSRRTSSAAGFQAEMGAWEARRNLANSATSYLAAAGVDASVVSPGSKPTDMMAMGMTGMLGGHTKSQANFFGPGGFGAVVGNQAVRALNQSYGEAAIGRLYQSGINPIGEAGRAWDSFRPIPLQLGIGAGKAGDSLSKGDFEDAAKQVSGTIGNAVGGIPAPARGSVPQKTPG